MPLLKNPLHEAFAEARAGGATLYEAYKDAGYSASYAHASRLASDPAVAERIAELRALAVQERPAHTSAVVAELLRIAKTSEGLNSPAGIKEARLTLLEAHRISEEAESDRRLKRR